MDAEGIDFLNLPDIDVVRPPTRATNASEFPPPRRNPALTLSFPVPSPQDTPMGPAAEGEDSKIGAN
jgi:hypothetical protein